MQLKTGSTLQNGKYEIIRTLGQGGFGITYLAEQVALKKKVAIKEFFMKDCCERDDGTGSVRVGTGSQRNLVKKFRGKFIREAQMIAGLDHPGIVQVTDVFEENDTAYYVMENLPSGSLSEIVKRDGPLPESEALRYIRQVADALAYLHQRNTVHLDVKPSNILLNAKGQAVLIDFGISKHYDDSGEQTSSTPVGISKGFAPLEQGRSGDVSQFKPSTDIYALGATLFFLLTGKTPPEASIVNEDGLERPAGISDGIWTAIETAMRPRRIDRPKSIPEFLGLLPGQEGDVEVEEEEVTTVPGTAGQPEVIVRTVTAPAPKAKPWPLYVSSVLLLLALLFFFLSLSRTKKPEPGRSAVVSQQDVALSQRVDSLQKVVVSLKTEISTQKKQNKDVGDNNARLSATNRRLQDENASLKKQVNDLNGRLNRMLGIN